MQRYIEVSYDEAKPEVREVYDDFLRSTGLSQVPIWVKSLGSNTALLRAYWERTKGTLVHGQLPSVLKEMVIFVVSVENGSRYCSACHAHAILSMDKTMKFEDLSAILDAKDQRIKLPPPLPCGRKFRAKGGAFAKRCH